MKITDAVDVERSKQQIESDLSLLAPSVQVVASRMTEDGYTLVLEGEPNELASIIHFWGQGCK